MIYDYHNIYLYLSLSLSPYGEWAQVLVATKIVYSKNHNLMRTVGFVTILAAATCLQNNDQLLGNYMIYMAVKKNKVIINQQISMCVVDPRCNGREITHHNIHPLRPRCGTRVLEESWSLHRLALHGCSCQGVLPSGHGLIRVEMNPDD